MSKKEKKSLLSATKDFITIMILLSIFAIISVFGYRFITNKKIIACANPPQNEKATATTATSVASATDNRNDNTTKIADVNDTNKTKAPSQKLYTQDEVQELMDMLVDQMNELKNQEKSSTKISDSTSDNSEDTTQLAQSLKNLSADSLDENIDIASQDLSDASAKKTKTVDTYNKVVLDNSTVADNRTKDLAMIVNSMNDDQGSSYTQNIKEEIKTREDEMRVIIVRYGDTLSKIAIRAYGSPDMYTKIYEANPDIITNPNRIYVGQKLRVPTI